MTNFEPLRHTIPDYQVHCLVSSLTQTRLMTGSAHSHSPPPRLHPSKVDGRRHPMVAASLSAENLPMGLRRTCSQLGKSWCRDNPWRGCPLFPNSYPPFCHWRGWWCRHVAVLSTEVIFVTNVGTRAFCPTDGKTTDVSLGYDQNIRKLFPTSRHDGTSKASTFFPPGHACFLEITLVIAGPNASSTERSTFPLPSTTFQFSLLFVSV